VNSPLKILKRSRWIMHTSFLDSLEDSPGSRNMNNSVDDPKIE
jgi:hypothetical protein